MSEQVLDTTLQAADVLLRVVARTVIAVEDVVTGPQLRVLVLIFRGGPTTPGAVAAELKVHGSNATRVCSRLQRSGLIDQVPAGSDRRLRMFDLSPRGRALVSGVMAQRRAALKSIIERLSEAEAAALQASLEGFARAARQGEESEGGLTLGASQLTDFT